MCILRVCYTGARTQTKTYDIIFFVVRRWRWSLGYLVPPMWNKYHLNDIRLLLPFLFFSWYISYHAEIRVVQWLLMVCKEYRITKLCKNPEYILHIHLEMLQIYYRYIIFQELKFILWIWQTCASFLIKNV